MTRIEFSFENMKVPAEIEAPPELFSALAMFGLTFAPGHDDGAPPPIIVRSGPQDFQISGDAYISPFAVQGQDAAAGSVLAGLVGWKALHVDDGTLCIHGAAVSIADRTFVFLAPFGAGKSSLVAALAQRGARILTDDAFLLNVAARTVRGMRLPLRLRRRFIAGASPELAGWIRPRLLFSGPRFAYLFPDERPDTEHPLTDVVLLSRESSPSAGGPYLEAAPPGLLLPRLLWHNLSRHHSPSRISALAMETAHSVRTGIFHYSDVETAADVLLRGDIEMRAAGAHPKIEAELRDSFHIARTSNGAVISCDETGKIFEINESALVILKLLQEFPENKDAWSALRTIYDEVPEQDLAEHFRQSLRLFAENGLIHMERLDGTV